MSKKIVTIFLIILIIVSIGAAFFVPTNLVSEYGVLVYAGIGVLVIVIIGLIVVVNKESGSKVDPLLVEKQQALVALKQAETDFFHRKINKTTFEKISQENNAKLIGIESKLELKKNNSKSESKKSGGEGGSKKKSVVSREQKKLIEELSKKKELKLSELKKAEVSFYHRKINEENFKKISSNIKEELIRIDSQIKGIIQSEEIEKLKEELRGSAKELKQKKKRRGNEEEDDYWGDIGEDLLKQLN